MKKFPKIQTGLLIGVLIAGLLPTAFAQVANTSGGFQSGSGTQPAAPFSDVSSTSVNADAITYLKTNNVLQGYSDGTFKPDAQINRAEFTKIVVAALYPNPQGSNCFPDVNTQWFAPYVCTAKAKGILTGYPDGTFQPDSTINFSEAAKVVANAFAVTGGQPAGAGDQWFKPYVTALENKSAIPLSVNYFDGNVTRGTMAEMIYRLKADVTDKATRTYNEVVGNNFVSVNSCVQLQERLDEQNAYNMETGSGQVNSGGPVMQPLAAPTPAPVGTGTMNQNMLAPMAQSSGAASSNTSAPAALAPATSAGSASDFSTTNVQVAGVDEADIVKNDGKYIYIIKDNQIRIVEAYPPQNLQELVSFTLGDSNETFTPSEMYVDGNTLTVIGSDYIQPYPVPTPLPGPIPAPVPLTSSTMQTAGTMQTTQGNAATTGSAMPAVILPGGVAAPGAPNMIMPIRYPYYNTTRTKVYVIDITDRTKPVVTRSVEFDGYYNTSRKINGTLYMVMNYDYSPYIYYPQPMVMDSSGSVTSGASASGGGSSTGSAVSSAPAGGSASSASSAASVVPMMMDTKNGTEQMVAPCSQIHILPKTTSLSFLITAAIPLNDLTKDVSTSVILGSSDNVYASTDNLYVASQDGGGGFYRPYNDYGTDIYRFALGNDSISYASEGTVPGQLLDQYSMDESNGYFRVATTSNEYVPGSEISNNVYVMDMNMNITGKLENIAAGEKLYSARFMGNTAYLVTFKRVDPFFVLDLSDASNPKIAGKLLIPGYSQYLQPYDATHILGFGYDVDASKVLPDTSSEPGFLTPDAIKGLKISLFDVSDLSNPKEEFSQIIGDQGTTSAVLSDPKALLFDQSMGLLALPVTVYSLSAPNVSCSQYTYSTCPTTCQQVCVPSSCTTTNGIQVCTADCGGANSCVPSTNNYPKATFDGAYVYSLNLTNGFQLKGQVTHYSAADQAQLLSNGYPDYTKTIQRLMYIGQSLYSVSPSAVEANSLTDLSQQGLIQLAASPQPVYYGGVLPM